MKRHPVAFVLSQTVHNPATKVSFTIVNIYLLVQSTNLGEGGGLM